MALYWPEQHVALEIVDDPHARPFDCASDPDATVIQTTVAEISDLESFRALAKRLAAALGENPPEDTPLFRRRQAELHTFAFSRANRYRPSLHNRCDTTEKGD